MINIKETEDALKGILDAAAMVSKYAIKPYKLIAYPGELEQLGQPINCATVHIQFKNIEYDKAALTKLGQCCVGQINKVYFTITVLHNNLRCYDEVYSTSSAIIKELRGRKCAVMDTDSLSAGASACTITKFEFKKVTNGGAMYEAQIDVLFEYTDKYDIETII